MALAAYLHWRRFHVPVTVAAGCGAIFVIVLGLWGNVPADAVFKFLWVPFLFCGLAAFSLALWYDARDTNRTTRRADIAFWLHLLAAPLIVHSTIGGLVLGASFSPYHVAVILGVYAILAAVALTIDRRALLVSGLSYLGFAATHVFKAFGLGGEFLGLPMLSVGAFVLLIAFGWRPLRAALIPLLPDAVRRRVPAAA
jgi:hypothetical protein